MIRAILECTPAPALVCSLTRRSSAICNGSSTGGAGSASTSPVFFLSFELLDCFLSLEELFSFDDEDFS